MEHNWIGARDHDGKPVLVNADALEPEEVDDG